MKPQLTPSATETSRITHYRILKVLEAANTAQIELAFVTQARQAAVAPFGRLQREYWFFRLHRAYEILVSRRKRAAYDRALREDLSPRPQIGFTSDVLERSFEFRFVVDPIERWLSIYQMSWKGAGAFPRTLLLRKALISLAIRTISAAFGAILGVCVTLFAAYFVFPGFEYGPLDPNAPGIILKNVPSPATVLSAFFFLFGGRMLAFSFRVSKYS